MRENRKGKRNQRIFSAHKKKGVAYLMYIIIIVICRNLDIRRILYFETGKLK